MNDIALATDSSALLSPAAAAALGVEVIPVNVALDGEEITDQATVDDFYDRMRRGAVATTSQPTVAALVAAYRRLAEHGARTVLSIHLDGRVSGTVHAANAAAEAAPVRVEVLDSGTVSFGVALCVRAATSALAAGGDVASAREAVVETTRSTQNAFVARPAHAGRVPVADGWPLLEHAGGRVSPIEQCDSPAVAVEGMVRRVAASEHPVRAAVGHAGREVEAAADELAHRLLAGGNVVTVERYRVGPAVGAHTGPESFGLFWWPADR